MEPHFGAHCSKNEKKKAVGNDNKCRYLPLIGKEKKELLNGRKKNKKNKK